MADEPQNNAAAKEERTTEMRAKRTAAPRKNKRRGPLHVLKMFFIVLCLLLGLAAGLHFSGYWDARAAIWWTLPRVPYAGPFLAELFQVPERYSLTAAQRRRLELEEWEQRLDARERLLAQRSAEMNAVSFDVASRSQQVEVREMAIIVSQDEVTRGTPSAADMQLAERLARTYREMSPRNAARILEQIHELLAVELLLRFPTEDRAAIMEKMNPKKAARLTELMTAKH